MMNRSNWLFGIKLLVGIGILLWLLSMIDSTQLKAASAKIHIGWLMLGMLLAGALVWLQGLRQYCFLAYLQLTQVSVVKLQFVSTFIGHFLPAAVGSDIYKTLYLRQHTSSLLLSGELVLVDRLFGMLTTSIIGFYALWLDPAAIVPWLPKAFAAYLHLLLPALLALAVMGTGLIYYGVKQKRNWSCEINWTAVLILNLLSYSAQLLKFWVFCWMMDIELGWSAWAQILIIQQFIALLPLTVGGLGVVESGIVALMAWQGIASADGAIVALVNRLSVILIALLGGVFWLQAKRAEAQSSPVV